MAHVGVRLNQGQGYVPLKILSLAVAATVVYLVNSINELLLFKNSCGEYKRKRNYFYFAKQVT